MGWLGVLMSGVAAWLLWDNGIIWIVSAIGVGLVQFWSWGIMHNHAVMAARNRSSYSGEFYDFTNEEVDSIPNWITVVVLTRFRGHLNLTMQGVHDAKDKKTLPTGVSRANGRAGSSGPYARGVVDREFEPTASRSSTGWRKLIATRASARMG